MQVITILEGHSKRVSGLAFSNDLNLLVSCGADAQVSVGLYEICIMLNFLDDDFKVISKRKCVNLNDTLTSVICLKCASVQSCSLFFCRFLSGMLKGGTNRGADSCRFPMAEFLFHYQQILTSSFIRIRQNSLQYMRLTCQFMKPEN